MLQLIISIDNNNRVVMNLVVDFCQNTNIAPNDIHALQLTGYIVVLFVRLSSYRTQFVALDREEIGVELSFKNRSMI